MLEIVHATGDDELAQVFVARLQDGFSIEFVESVQPPVPREDKWVLIVSTLRGCPVGCPICDAGGSYAGKLTREEIMAQIDFLIRRRFPEGSVPIPKLKVQFARMGDPALNEAVVDVLEALPGTYELPGLIVTGFSTGSSRSRIPSTRMAGSRCSFHCTPPMRMPGAGSYRAGHGHWSRSRNMATGFTVRETDGSP